MRVFAIIDIEAAEGKEMPSLEELEVWIAGMGRASDFINANCFFRLSQVMESEEELAKACGR